MRLLLSRKISRKEFGRILPADDLAVLQRTARVVLATPIAETSSPLFTK